MKRTLFAATALITAFLPQSAPAEMLGLGPYANRSEVVATFGVGDQKCRGVMADQRSVLEMQGWIAGFISAVAHREGASVHVQFPYFIESEVERACAAHPEETVNDVFVPIFTREWKKK